MTGARLKRSSDKGRLIKRYTALERRNFPFILSVLIIPLISFAIFYVYLNIDNIVLTFQKTDIYGNRTFVGFDNFIAFFDQIKGDGQVAVSIKNSLFMYAVSFAVSMPLYLIFSYYIFKKFIGANVFRIVSMFPQIVSVFVYTLVYSKFVENALPDLMKVFGIADFPQLIFDENYAMFNNLFFSIWVSFGTSIIVYSNAMHAIDDEIFESAQLDGTNDRQLFFSIVLPLIWPTLSTFIITGSSAVLTWSGSLLTFYMYDAPPTIWGFGYYLTRLVKQKEGLADFPMGAAAGLMVSLVSLVYTLFIRWLCDKLDRTKDAV